MSRPKSAVLSAADQKAVVANLKTKIKSTTAEIKTLVAGRAAADKAHAGAIKAADKDLAAFMKTFDKSHAALNKDLSSLQAQLVAMTPPTAPAPVTGSDPVARTPRSTKAATASQPTA